MSWAMGFFFCIFYLLLFQCAFRHQPLLLKYFFVFKLGSCHFPHKRGVQEEKSEFVHCFGRWPATCRDFISPLAVVQPGSGLFSSLDVASKLHGLSAGHLEEGVVAHTEDSGKRSKAALCPSSPLCLHTHLLLLLLEGHALQGRSPVRGPGTTRGSGLRLLSLSLASSPLLLRT